MAALCNRRLRARPSSAHEIDRRMAARSSVTMLHPRLAEFTFGPRGARTRGLARTRALASSPQLLRRQPGALGERGELHPHDLGIDLQPAGEGAEAAVDAGDDVLATDHARILHDAVRHQLGMLDEVRG